MRTFLCGKGGGCANVLRAMVGRYDQIVVYSPDPGMQAAADEMGVSWTEESINQWHLWSCQPDLIVSVGCLEIMTPAVIEMVDGRVINCHYALLPNHRGRSSVPWAILDGDTATGVTWHWIDASIDTGRVLLQATCQIERDETQGSLFAKLDRLAGEYWPAAAWLALIKHPGVIQRGRTQYHRAGPPHGGVIDPTWRDDYIERFIRAMTHPPLAYATFDGHEVRTFADYERLRREYAARDHCYADA